MKAEQFRPGKNIFYSPDNNVAVVPFANKTFGVCIDQARFDDPQVLSDGDGEAIAVVDATPTVDYWNRQPTVRLPDLVTRVIYYMNRSDQ